MRDDMNEEDLMRLAAWCRLQMVDRCAAPTADERARESSKRSLIAPPVAAAARAWAALGTSCPKLATELVAARYKPASYVSSELRELHKVLT
jgi:hypothetical protein